jgi:hypothetical protein
MPHSWRFYRAGGVDQVRLETSDDLRNLATLDQKLWMALACPVRGVEIDERMLALIDTDGDQRIRAPEVLGAVDFVCRLLREPADVLGAPGPLALAGIRDDHAEGRGALASARTIVEGLGKATATAISVADVADQAAIFAALPFNGDGVVTEASATDAELQAVIRDVIACVGGDPDRSGKDGVSAARVETFFAACAAYAAWSGRGDAEGATLLPLGLEGTPAAAAAVDAVRAKVDDFFARVRFAAFDTRSLASLNGTEADVAALAARVFSAGCEEAEGFPLAHVQPGRALPLVEGVNPAWVGRVAALRTQAVVPLLGERTELSAADWDTLEARLAPYRAWQAAEEGGAVAQLGAPRVASLVAGSAKAALLALVAQDEARRADADAIAVVERLVRYRAGLGQLLRNFVSFADFYGRKEKAIFQAGTVYFDQRSCELVVGVQDAARHGSMAGLAGAYLTYLDCTRRVDGRKLQVCAAVTDGDSGNLMVGRNGLFYDRQGRDYDATITRIVANPISLREAFWSPYLKGMRAVEDFVAKRAAAAAAESDGVVVGAAEKAAHVEKTPPPVQTPKIDVGTVAALGVAVGGITAALGAILQAIFGLGLWMPIGLAGIILLVSGPSVFIAALKLRKRNIGPILDADGWALNTQARVNLPFGRSLTQLATLPAGARRDLVDPFAPERSRAPYLVAVLLLVVVLALVLSATGVLHLPGVPPVAAVPPPVTGAGAGAAPTAPAAPAAP